eukprot:10008675-Karenia_brevis.AAC.1
MISSLTTLLKPNQRVRGIAAGGSFWRLVTETLAKQFQDDLRDAVMPHNSGLSDRSGTDVTIHFLRDLSDKCPRE